MVLVVRCSLCGDILECPKSDKRKLLDHIQEKHPEIVAETESQRTQSLKHMKEGQIQTDDTNSKNSRNDDNIEYGRKQEPKDNNNIKFDETSHFGYKNIDKAELSSKNGIKQNKKSNYAAKVLYERKYKKVKPLKQDNLDSKRRRLYRSTIEKWRPGIAKISCPQCGEMRTPIIKSKQDRVAKSPFGNGVISICWPFCFLPFLFPPPTHEYIHCRVCNHFLGIYDYEAEKVRAIIQKSMKEEKSLK